jgi:hypothetical protein
VVILWMSVTSERGPDPEIALGTFSLLDLFLIRFVLRRLQACRADETSVTFDLPPNRLMWFARAFA